jgi:ribosomal protein L22/exonuclease VII small subunit
MDQIQSATGVDISEALESIVGDGNLTPVELNRVFTFVNQRLAAGVTPLPLISGTQLRQFAASQLQAALSSSGLATALSANPNGVPVSNAVFTLQGSATPISFTNLLATIQQNTGINITTPINAILNNGPLTSGAIFRIAAGIIAPNTPNVQDALGKLQDLLNQLSDAFSNPNQVNDNLVISPNGVGADQPILFDQSTPEAIAHQNIIDQLPALNQAILTRQTSVLDAQNALNAAQSNLASGNFLPEDQLAIDNAKDGLAPISDWPSREADLAAVDGAQLNYDVAQENLVEVQTSLEGNSLPSRSFLSAMKNAIAEFSSLVAVGKSDSNRPIPGLYFLEGFNPQVKDYAGLPEWPGLMSFLEIDPNNAEQVQEFNDCLEMLFPDTFKGGAAIADMEFTADDLESATAQADKGINAWENINDALEGAQASLQAAQQALTNAQETYNANALGAGAFSPMDDSAIDAAVALAISHLTQAVSTVQVSLDLATSSLSDSWDALNSVVSAELTQSNPQRSVIQSQIASLSSAINTDLQAGNLNLPGTQASLASRLEQLQQLQERLLTLPNVSLSDVLSDLETNIDIEMSGALSSIVGGGLITAGNIGTILASFDPIELNTVAVSQDFSGVDAELNNFTVHPRVQGALRDVGLIFSQLTPEDLDANFQLSFTNETFNIPAIATYLGLSESTPVSLSQIFEYEAGSRGVDLSGVFPNLVDGNGKITLENLNTLRQLINQGVPGSNIAPVSSGLITSGTTIYQAQLATANGQISQIDTLLTALNLPILTNQQRLSGAAINISTLIEIGESAQSTNYSAIATVGMNPANTAAMPATTYAASLAGLLGIPQPVQGATLDARRAQLVVQYDLVKEALSEILPDFQFPTNSIDWTSANLSALQSQLQAQRVTLSSQATNAQGRLTALSSSVNQSISQNATNRLDITVAKTALQNIQFEDVEVALQSGAASAEVAASARAFNPTAPSILSAAEMNSQLEDGDLYVNAQGQFFLNRQPTNARDASVAAMVISGARQNEKLNDMMNKINLNNTKILMANYLSAATSVSDLQTRIAAQREQYGFADILGEITGGAMSDGDIVAGTDISSATSTFQSTLKTAINNATNNQDLDTQSLQQLTSEIQANRTAITQLIQAFEQMLKGLAQNLR